MQIHRSAKHFIFFSKEKKKYHETTSQQLTTNSLWQIKNQIIRVWLLTKGDKTIKSFCLYSSRIALHNYLHSHQI